MQGGRGVTCEMSVFVCIDLGNNTMFPVGDMTERGVTRGESDDVLFR